MAKRPYHQGSQDGPCEPHRAPLFPLPLLPSLLPLPQGLPLPGLQYAPDVFDGLNVLSCS